MFQQRYIGSFLVFELQALCYLTVLIVVFFFNTSVLAAEVKTVRTVTALAHNDTPKHLDASHMPYANVNAPKGGRFSQWANGSFDSFNNMIDKGTPAAGLNLVYESLMQGSLDEAFSMYPLLAEKVTYDPDDASWIIYHINPNARFSDGTPVTSQDVKFTFDKLLSEGAMFYRNYLSAIKDVTALDRYRVKFTFKNGDNQEIRLVVGQISIISKAYFTKHEFNKVSLEPPLGSGPYKIKNFQAGRFITYERNPNYWGKDLMINRGAYNFDEISYKYYRDGSVSFEGFKAGQYLFREENKARNWAVNYDFPAIKKGLVLREQVKDESPVPMQAFVFNLRKPMFADIRVRKALNLAYDFEWMNTTLFFGAYERLHSLFQGSELEAKGVPSAAEMAVLKPLMQHLPAMQQQEIMQPLGFEASDSTGFNRAKLIQAQTLLREAGFTYKKGKLYTPQGELARIEFLNNNDSLNRIFLPYIKNLRRLGFTVDIRLLDIPQFVERARQFDFDAISSVFPQGLSPGQEQLDYWSSMSADQPGSRNYAGIKNKAVDIIIEKIMHAQNRDKLIVYAKVLDRLLITGYYFMPMYGKSTDNIAYWKGLKHPKVLPKYDIGLNYWWSDAAEQAKVDKAIGR